MLLSSVYEVGIVYIYSDVVAKYSHGIFCVYYKVIFMMSLKMSNVYLWEEEIEHLIDCSDSESDLSSDNDNDQTTE